MRLYEYTEQYAALLDMVQSGDATEEDIQDTLEAIRPDGEEAVAELGMIVRELAADEKRIHAEIERLKARKSKLGKRREKIKEYIYDSMCECGMRKVEMPLISISIRKNPDSVLLSDQFVKWAATYGRDDLLRYKDPEPDKRKIMEALKAGDKLPAEIVHSEGISIK